MIALLAIYWGYFFFVRNNFLIKRALLGYLGLVIVSTGVFMYKYEVKRLYGFDGLSLVTTVNNYFFVRAYNLLDTTLIDNPDLRKTVHTYIETRENEVDSIWAEIGIFSNLESTAEITTAINQSIMRSPRKSLGAIYHRTGFAAQTAMFRGLMRTGAYNTNCRHVWIDDYMGGFYTIFIPTFNSLNIFLIVYLVFLVWRLYKRRKFDFMSWFLWLYVFSSYAVAILGAMGDWARLTVQILPGILLMTGKVLSNFRCRSMAELR